MAVGDVVGEAVGETDGEAVGSEVVGEVVGKVVCEGVGQLSKEAPASCADVTQAQPHKALPRLVTESGILTLARLLQL